MKKSAIRVLMFCCMALFLFGCAAGDGERQPNGYQIYYTNSEGTGLVSFTYSIENQVTEELVNELLNLLGNAPDEPDYICAKPDGVTVTGVQMSDDTLLVYFDEAYTQMNPTQEILCRAAYVRTLTQAPGVDSVEFYVGDNPLKDSAGEEVGRMKSEDFIENTSDEINAYQSGQVTLYFASKDGKSLVEVGANVILSANSSTEKLIVEKLLAGPDSNMHGVNATIPSNTKLLGVYTDERICYVNLSEDFLVPMPEVSEKVTLYSIVNSLCALPTVDKVQISVNGEVNKSLTDSLTLETPFEEDQSLISE